MLWRNSTLCFIILHFRHGNNTSPDINRADLGVRDVRVSSFLWGFAKWLRHSTLTATSCVRFADPQFTVCDYMDLRRLHFVSFRASFSQSGSLSWPWQTAIPQKSANMPVWRNWPDAKDLKSFGLKIHEGSNPSAGTTYPGK